MKVVLRQIGTGKYLNKDCKWIESMEAARIFNSVIEARDYCQQNIIGKAEIVARFNGHKDEVVMDCPER